MGHPPIKLALGGMNHQTLLELSRKRALGLGLVFFVYGGVLHLALLRAYVHHAYSPPADTGFVNHPLTNASVAALGGLFVSWFLLGLLRYALDPRSVERLRIILRGGFYGILATFLALELFYVLAAVFVAAWYFGSGRESTFVDRFTLSLIGIQTFGLIPITYSLPFDFVYGAVAGTFIVVIRKYFAPKPFPIPRLDKMARVSLALGILGLVCFWLPLVGVLVNLLAIVFGAVAIRKIEEHEATGKNMATVGIALGALGVGAFLAILVWFGFQR